MVFDKEALSGQHSAPSIDGKSAQTYAKLGWTAFGMAQTYANLGCGA